MEKVSQDKIKSLLSLLDDPDETVGSGAMGELLRCADESLLPILGELQESPDPVLRRRVQQLQSILTVRSRRQHFLEILKEKPLDLLDGLIEVHLLWFDNDSKVALQELIHSFLEVAANNELKTLADVGKFMQRGGFETPCTSEQCMPENYCIGSILGERIGADFMLCVLALLVGAEAGLELGLIHVMDRFAVVDPEGVMISPVNDWVPDRLRKMDANDFWNEPAAILKYASLMLFLFAVSSDNFRYVHTIGHAVSGTDERQELDFLPYPYGGKSPEGESN